MATGSGQFFLSLRQGLATAQPGRHEDNARGSKKKTPARPGCRRRFREKRTQPPPCHPRSWPHRVFASSEDYFKREKQTKPQPPPCHAKSWPHCVSASSEDYFKRLPPEIILKILSYLDVASLYSVGFVNRQFHQLANDNMVWYNLYTCETGIRKWRPRLCEPPSDPVSADVRDVPTAVWKKTLFREMGYHQDAVWKKELRVVNINTGMPEHTEQVLRRLGVVWEITLSLKGGKQSVYKPTRVSFSDSSVYLCWSGIRLPSVHLILSMQLYGVLGSFTTLSTKPQWRSLLSKTLVRGNRWRHIGVDSQVKLLQFNDGITVGLWRSSWTIIFIMATLHFHNLVERSVLGSLFCPYRPEEFSSLYSDFLPGSSVPGYTVLMLLHNSVRRIIRCQYSPVLCTRDMLNSEYVQLLPVSTSMSHTPITSKISFPWKAGKLQGEIPNCCVMTLTVLDEAQRPMWCISSSVLFTLSHSQAGCETYDGEQLFLRYADADGKLKMTLVWMQDLQLYFLSKFHIWIHVQKLDTPFA